MWAMVGLYFLSGGELSLVGSCPIEPFRGDLKKGLPAFKHILRWFSIHQRGLARRFIAFLAYINNHSWIRISFPFSPRKCLQ